MLINVRNVTLYGWFNVSKPVRALIDLYITCIGSYSQPAVLDIWRVQQNWGYKRSEYCGMHAESSVALSCETRELLFILARR